MKDRKEQSRRYYLKYKEEIKKRNRLYAQNHKEEYAEYKKLQYLKKKEFEGDYWLEKYQGNKEYHRQYNKANRKKINQYMLNRKDKPEIRILHNLRSRIYSLLKGKNKSNSTLKLLDCSIEKLKQRLERLFVRGMTWDNYGKWHIDHITPCYSFDLLDSDEQKKCFHYTNLQPLWKIDNLIKARKT